MSINLEGISVDIKKEIGSCLCKYRDNCCLFDKQLFINDKCNLIKYKYLKECTEHGDPVKINIIQELLRYKRNINNSNNNNKKKNINTIIKESELIYLHFNSKESTDYFSSIKCKLGFNGRIIGRCCEGKGISYK